MKRTGRKKPKLTLKRRLELVRTTIRDLTPTQLEQVNGGYTEYYDICIPGWTRITDDC
jgi:hypothetical protein